VIETFRELELEKMLAVDIPGYKTITVKNLILDLNGTIAVDGKLRIGVAEKINKLSQRGIKVYVVTAGTHGRIEEIKKDLNVELLLINRGDEDAQKRDLIEKIGKGVTVAVGNGANDYLMLKEAVLSIVVLEDEGAYLKNLFEADIVTKSSEGALDLLLNPKRLVATLRR